MTDMCEIAESLGTATSSCPDTTVAVMVYEAGAAISGVTLGFVLGVSSTGVGSTAASPDHYALLVSTAAASDDVLTTTLLSTSEESSAAGRSEVTITIPLSVSAAGVAESAITLEVPPHVLTSIGVAASAAAPVLVFEKALTSSAQAASTLTVYLAESAASSASGTSATSHSLVATTVVTSVATAASAAPFVSLVPNLEVLESIGATSSVISAKTDWTVVQETGASAASTVLFKDPGRVAWVMNTESTAMSWYDNFDVESIAQVGDTTIAVGPEGIFELVGDTDDGETINAVVRSGFRDFGTANTKRLDTIYIGYVSSDTLAALVRVKDSGHAASYFEMEAREASAPRTSRITPAKGLWGRYWQIELRNASGGPFTVYDMDADLAVSQRKL